jgi:hypothetical protein
MDIVWGIGQDAGMVAGANLGGLCKSVLIYTSEIPVYLSWICGGLWRVDTLFPVSEEGCRNEKIDKW